MVPHGLPSSPKSSACNSIDEKETRSMPTLMVHQHAEVRPTGASLGADAYF